MQAVILAGGLGSRLTEETRNRPKPMVEIGGMPILWHIMQIYAHHGVKEFIICLGYRGEMIKEFFINLPRYSNNLTVHSDGVVEYLSPPENDWKVSLVETGALTQTGGRLKKIANLLTGDVFCMTYGDGVASVNIRKLINFHSKHELCATVTATHPAARFGALNISGSKVVTGFAEKPLGEGGWVNGGFFVLNKQVLDLITSEDTIWEQEPMQSLVKNGQLAAFPHEGFWQPMDTLREKQMLEELWSSGNAPWKVWD